MTRELDLPEAIIDSWNDIVLETLKKGTTKINFLIFLVVK